MDCALYEKAQIDYAFYESTLQIVADNMNYLGHLAFFLEQAVEKMLRQVLLDCNISAPLLSQVPELAKIAKESILQFDGQIARALMGDVGVQLVAWDLSGRYTQMYTPDLEVIGIAESIYASLVDLHKELLASSPNGITESYTDHFRQFVSERT